MAQSLMLDASPALLARIRCGVCLLALHELGDGDAADEVAQETLARLIQAHREGRVRETDRLSAFARGIARHVILDLIRARQRRTTNDAATLGRLESNAEDPLTALVCAEQERAVRLALTALSDDDRELLRRSFFEGATSEEMAQSLHEPASRVRKRKERAVERLRRAFYSVHRHIADDVATELGVRAQEIPRFSVVG